nr:hypothetical protein [Bacteroidota bacterium]
MKKTALFLLLTALAIMGNAQKSKIEGSWLMIKAEVGGEVQEPYFITDFKENGTMEIMGMDAGSWKYDKNSHTIVMESELDKDFSGESKIISITENELVVVKNEAKLFYIKINPDEILENNKVSGLGGTWKIENAENTEVSQLLKFELPDAFVLIEMEYGATSTTRGTWIFNTNDETLTLIGRTQLLRGKSTIQSFSTEKLVLENKGSIVIAMKQNDDSNKVERLTFEFKEFEDENTGEYISSDESGLPWLEFEEMVSFLGNVEYIKYRQGSLIEEMNSFNYSTILSTIAVNSEEQTVEFTNLSISDGDTMQYSQNYKGGLMESYNYFFPKEGPMPYRIPGTESVTTAAGTFECTVVEGFDGFDKVKYWLISAAGFSMPYFQRIISMMPGNTFLANSNNALGLITYLLKSIKPDATIEC